MKAFLICISLYFLLIIPSVFAQQGINGKVTDEKGVPLESVSISLKRKDGQILSYTLSDAKGLFQLKITADRQELLLSATTIGFEQKTIELKTPGPYQINLKEGVFQLKSVEIKNTAKLILTGDTLNYKTSDFAGKQDRTIGDVLKKMPGMEIEQNGNIKYNGKSISNLYIDGDNVLNNRYNIGTKIPHGAVDQVQVIEKDQPVKLLRKQNISDDVALNLVIKPEARATLMGEAAAGLGTPGKYDLNAFIMLLSKNNKSINSIKADNTGEDPGLELTVFNGDAAENKKDNNQPGNLLSAAAGETPALPQNRYLFNQAWMANLNQFHKMKNDLSLQTTLSWLSDQRMQQFSKSSQTYLPGQTISYQETQDNTINLQKLHLGTTLNANKDDYYLNNTFSADYGQNKTISKAIINGTNASQGLQQHTYDLFNELNYRKKLKSANLLNFYTYQSFTAKPESLKITPGFNDSLLNNGLPYAGLDQQVNRKTFYTNNYATYAFVHQNLIQNYKVGFNLQQQQLSTDLYQLQNEQTQNPVAGQTSNDLSWLKSKLFFESKYQYKKGRFQSSLSLPLSYQSIHYQDQKNALDKSLDKIFLNPGLNIRYDTGIENYLQFGYDYTNNLGGIEDVYKGIILKDYRSLFSNDAPVTQQNTHHVNGTFNFKKSTQMLFINLSVDYMANSLNTISSYTLSNNAQQRVVLPIKNNSSDLVTAVNASKYLLPLRSTITAGISYKENKFDQLQNNELLPFQSQVLSYTLGVDTKINQFLSITYKGNYLLSQNRSALSDQISTKYGQLNQEGTLTTTLFQSLFVSFSATQLFTHQNGQANLNYIFADLNTRYYWAKLKTELQFGLTNLGNIRQFGAINTAANAISSSTYRIPGRVAMFKVAVHF